MHSFPSGIQAKRNLMVSKKNQMIIMHIFAMDYVNTVYVYRRLSLYIVEKKIYTMTEWQNAEIKGKREIKNPIFLFKVPTVNL